MCIRTLKINQKIKKNPVIYNLNEEQVYIIVIHIANKTKLNSAEILKWKFVERSEF